MSTRLWHWPANFFRWCFRCFDNIWRRWHRVRRIDSLLSLSLEPWKADDKCLPNGVVIRRGDLLGILHFNHGAFINRGERDGTGIRRALDFRSKLFASLRQLAARVQSEPEFSAIVAFHGITWFRAHGEKVGFVIEPLPDHWRTRLRALHFRLLLRAFFPALARREGKRLHPHGFWMTRQELITNFGKSSRHGVVEQIAQSH
jgi:hypothetical protein